MRVYYSHPICLYNTREEERAICIIKEHFKNADIVNPKKYYFEGMEDYLKLVSKCDILVFQRLLGFVTAGVGQEVSFALDRHIPVYELNLTKKELHQVTAIKTEEILTREETWIIYEEYRLKQMEGLL